MSAYNDEWVEIGSTVHPDEAIAWRDLMDSTGIEVRLVPDADAFDPYPGTSIFGPYKLMVQAKIESEARAALNDILNSQTSTEEID